jgi:hypothetical protein
LLLTPVRVLLLALALLLAQAAGLGHRVAHAGAIASAGALAARGAADVQTGVAASDHPAGSTECRLIDQLAHADTVLSGEPVALPMLLACRDREAAARPRPCAASPTAYLARAPPSA